MTSKSDDPLKAVSLRYDGTQAPHVAAKGEGNLADQIIAMAEAAGLYIHQDPALLERLEGLQEGETIPPALYVVIAEILSYSYMLQGKYPEHWRRQDGSSALDTQV
jgi:flagellar biosynthesis protein